MKPVMTRKKLKPTKIVKTGEVKSTMNVKIGEKLRKTRHEYQD